MNQQQVSEFRTRLVTLRDELGNVIAGDEQQLEQQLKHSLEGEARVDINHPADMAEGDSDYEKELTLVQRERDELADVEHALRRIAQGSYGICEECGEEISLQRLQAIPYTSYCRDCREMLDLEQERRARQSRQH